MKLIIVESPSKAKTIAKYLGEGYKVAASGGHVRDLPEKTTGVDVHNNYKPMYIVPSDKERTVKALREKVAKVDKVYLATDPDREGEAISWHLRTLLNIKDENIRIEFNEITKNSVLEAVKKPRALDMNLVNAQQARRILDRLVGYKVSPFLCTHVQNHLSAGRVQSVTLRMLVDREREIRNFKPEEYWNINGFFNKLSNDKTVFKAIFNDINGKKTKVVSKEQADEILNATKNAEIKVDKIDQKKTISKPNPPFTTSTMQQDGVNKLSFTAKQVMQLAQQLYEGIEIEGFGHIALITYMRTDSVRISPQAQSAARDFIQKTYGSEYVPQKPNVFKSKKGAQDAHEGIRPISLDISPEDIKDKVSKNLYKLYKFIYERFLASQMAPAIYDTLNVHISAKDNNKSYGYNLNGKCLKFAGYTAVYRTVKTEDMQQDDEAEETDILPQFTKDEVLQLKDLKAEQKFTIPPYRFTEASLVKTLEDSGIGRPSTYATILGLLSKRDYTTREKKYLIPTQLGELVVDELIKFFPQIMDINFTSAMEEKLDEIAEGKQEWVNVLDQFYPSFENQLKIAYSSKKVDKLPVVQSKIKCDKCGAPMNVIDGKYGKFYGCSNYPECKNQFAHGEIVGRCPKCGRYVIKRYAKKTRKAYYACVDQEKCGFVAWDLPADHFCKECGSTMKVQKSAKGNKNICTNKNCGYVEIVIPKDQDNS